MASQFPPKKNQAFTVYVSLISQSNTKTMQSNPTLAAGDVKVSIDGGALANLTTLPVVTPASSKAVKVDLSSSEMNGDNIVIIFSDAAGAEWCDLVLNLQTTARQIDDLSYPATSGRSTAVDASGNVATDVKLWTGTTVATPDTAGYPKVTIKDGTGTGEIDTTSGGVLVSTLATQAKADVRAEAVGALTTDTYAEPSAVPAATASLKDKIVWLAALARNKITQTSTTQTLRNDADSGTIATSTVADDGTTYTRGKFS